MREETLRDANRVLVNYHHALPLSQVFGGGTMSSSDGQRFPVRGKSATARHMNIFGGRVLSTYTHVSDQWSTYGTRVPMPLTPNRLHQAFRAESFGFSEVGAGVRFRERVFSEALDCAWEGPRPDPPGTTADQRERFLLRLLALSWLYPYLVWPPYITRISGSSGWGQRQRSADARGVRHAMSVDLRAVVRQRGNEGAGAAAR